MDHSSTAENLIHPNEGQKPIAEIKEGHKVFAEDPETGEQGYFEVVAVTSHPEDEILQITNEIEPGSRGAGVQGSNTLDTNDNASDNDTRKYVDSPA